MHKARSQLLGFTIVELLVVIVVIGILAAITIVSYSGISKQATIASLQSDLTNAAKQLKMFRVDNAMYPATFSVDCAAQPTTTANICLKASPGSTYTDYQVDDPSNPQSFTLTELKSSLYYSISDDGQPEFVASTRYLKVASAGDSQTCAVASDSLAYCWGYNLSGQLGNNSTTQSLVPVAVSASGVLSGKTVRSIVASDSQTCALASDAQAYCWGWNGYGQLGNNSTANSSVPVAVDTSGILSGKTIKSIVARAGHTCAIASDSQAYCWGYNNWGQLGNNLTANSSVPVGVNTAGLLSGRTVKSLAAGGNHTCAIASDSQAYCWGYNSAGQLGDSSATQSLVPVAVSTSGALSGKTIKSITAGSDYTCAIASDSQAYCWGYNGTGKLGNGSTASSSIPVTVTTSGFLSDKTIKTVSTGANHTCAIASDNQVYCWGWNGYGQLGNNSTANSSVPVAVSTSGALSGKTIKSITAGGDYTCAIASDSQAYCWGYNIRGQLGSNSTTNSLVPVAVTPWGS